MLTHYSWLGLRLTVLNRDLSMLLDSGIRSTSSRSAVIDYGSAESWTSHSHLMVVGCHIADE